MASLEQDLKLAQLESNFYRACNVVRTRGIELREVKTSFLDELLDIEQNKVIRLNREIEYARTEIERLQLAREEDQREIARLNEALLRAETKLPEAKPVQLLHQHSVLAIAKDSMTPPPHVTVQDVVGALTPPPFQLAIPDPVTPPPSQLPDPVTLRPFQDDAVNKAEPVATEMTPPPVQEDTSKKAERVSKEMTLPPVQEDTSKKAEPVAKEKTPPPVQEDASKKAEPVTKEMTPPPVQEDASKKAEPVTKEMTPPPVQVDAAEPVTKDSTQPCKKYIPRWPDLGEYMLIRGAKLNALAMLQKSETKRLIKRTRISQGPTEEHSKRASKGRKAPSKTGQRSIKPQRRSFTSKTEMGPPKRTSLVVKILLSSIANETTPDPGLSSGTITRMGRPPKRQKEMDAVQPNSQQQEKPFQCEQCGKGYVRFGSLQNHLRAHARPYFQLKAAAKSRPAPPPSVISAEVVGVASEDTPVAVGVASGDSTTGGNTDGEPIPEPTSVRSPEEVSQAQKRKRESDNLITGQFESKSTTKVNSEPDSVPPSAKKKTSASKPQVTEALPKRGRGRPKKRIPPEAKSTSDDSVKLSTESVVVNDVAITKDDTIPKLPSVKPASSASKINNRIPPEAKSSSDDSGTESVMGNDVAITKDDTIPKLPSVNSASAGIRLPAKLLPKRGRGRPKKRIPPEAKSTSDDSVKLSTESVVVNDVAITKDDTVPKLPSVKPASSASAGPTKKNRIPTEAKSSSATSDGSDKLSTESVVVNDVAITDDTIPKLLSVKPASFASKKKNRIPPEAKSSGATSDDSGKLSTESVVGNDVAITDDTIPKLPSVKPASSASAGIRSPAKLPPKRGRGRPRKKDRVPPEAKSSAVSTGGNTDGEPIPEPTSVRSPEEVGQAQKRKRESDDLITEQPKSKSSATVNSEPDSVPTSAKKKKTSASKPLVTEALPKRGRGRPKKNISGELATVSVVVNMETDVTVTKYNTIPKLPSVKPASANIVVRGGADGDVVGDGDGATTGSKSGSVTSGAVRDVDKPGEDGGDNMAQARGVVIPKAVTEDTERSGSPEIPFQITTLNVSVPISPLKQAVRRRTCTPPPSSHKPKRRKTLESVLSSILEHKLSKDNSPDSKSEKSDDTVTESRELEWSKAVQVGGAKKDKRLGREKSKPARKRKTLIGKKAREKSEAFKLSVVADEVERSNTIRMKTSMLVAPKLKQTSL